MVINSANHEPEKINEPQNSPETIQRDENPQSSLEAIQRAQAEGYSVETKVYKVIMTSPSEHGTFTAFEVFSGDRKEGGQLIQRIEKDQIKLDAEHQALLDMCKQQYDAIRVKNKEITEPLYSDLASLKKGSFFKKLFASGTKKRLGNKAYATQNIYYKALDRFDELETMIYQSQAGVLKEKLLPTREQILQEFQGFLRDLGD